MKIKMFKRDEFNKFYLVEWKTGYVEVWQDWTQWLQTKKYNWLNFRLIYLEFDYDKMAGEHLSIEFGFLGFNVRFHQFVKQNEAGRKLDKIVKEMETIEDSYEKKIKALRAEIKKLKQR